MYTKKRDIHLLMWWPRMRGICGQKKIGHTGTLDPDAEGVLPGYVLEKPQKYVYAD